MKHKNIFCMNVWLLYTFTRKKNIHIVSLIFKTISFEFIFVSHLNSHLLHFFLVCRYAIFFCFIYQKI